MSTSTASWYRWSPSSLLDRLRSAITLEACGLALIEKPLTVIFSIVERKVGDSVPLASPLTFAAEVPDFRPTVTRSWCATPMA